MFRWLSRKLGMGAETNNEEDPDDPFDHVPTRNSRREARSPRSRGRTEAADAGWSEEFSKNLEEANAIILDLDSLVAVWEAKRRARRSARLSDSTPTQSSSSSSSSSSRGSADKGKEPQSKASPSSGSSGRSSASTTPTGGPKLITLPPGGANKPIEVKGMVYNPDRKVWEGGKGLNLDEDDGDRNNSYAGNGNGNDSNLSNHRQIRKSSPHKTMRSVLAEDHVLDDTGEWVKKDLMEPTETEKSQPRLFLIRYLNPTSTAVANKMAGDMRLVGGKWVKASEEESDDMDAFGDDDDLKKWGEADTFFPELPKEFDVSEENVNQWRRREQEHEKEMGAWSAAEVDHKRFLLDGLRQMYIIRVVNQANAKDRAKDRAKRPQSVAVASATRQTSSAPTKLDKFKDESEFNQDLELDDDRQLSPRRRERTDDSEEDGFDEASSSNSESDWGLDFASPMTKKFNAPTMASSRSLEGIEIGDDDEDEGEDDDDMEMDDGDNAAAADNKGQEEQEDDWGDEFAEYFDKGLASRLPGVTTIGDDDEGDDEFEELNVHNKQKVAIRDGREDEDEEDWGMDDDEDDGAAPALNKEKSLLTGGDDDLVIADDDDDEAEEDARVKNQSRQLSRSRSGSFETV